MDDGLESRCVGRVYGADGAVRRMAPSARPPPIHKLGTENHMLQLNI